MKKKTLLTAMICATLLLPACQSSDSEPKESKTPTASSEVTPESTQEPTATPEPKVYDSTAAAEKYSSHPFLELWTKIEDVPHLDTAHSSIPKIIPYIASNNTKGGCVIICPGGAYIQLAVDKEGKNPAVALNENNITAFVLQYRTSYSYEGVLSDIFRAIRYVRANAEEFGIDPDKISVMGFSAGGHLTSMSMEHYDEDQQNVDEIDQVSAKPNLGILCYPVISLKDDKTHELTRKTFLGGDNEHNETLIKKYSAEEGVTKDTPPAFIWHCEPDEAVPVENSTDFAKAMKEKGIDCELHIYKSGAHGVGLATDNNEVKEWFPDCVKWLQSYGY